MPRRLCIFVALALALSLGPSPLARAQTGADPMAELDSLEAKLASGLAANDCAVACAALESMIRAADRVCEMDPGAACASARDKVESARKRVQASCPDCTAASDKQLPARSKTETAPKPVPGAIPAPEPREVAAKDAPGPPASEARGGCAACAVDPRRDTPLSLLALLGLLGLAVVRRRR